MKNEGNLTQKTYIRLLDLLLRDHSAKRNILWATDDYIKLGVFYSHEREITADLITGAFADVIRPRFAKTRDKQNSRTRNRAEVFTPSWICNQQNNLIDEQWFGRPGVFNKAEGKTWTANRSRIEFADKTWQEYVLARRMEIACGEAPYLVSRYDAVTGEMIDDIYSRIGILDRKLRVVCENADSEQEWFRWIKKAYHSTYGYEYQGDNLFIARQNLLLTFIDYMQFKFSRKPSENELQQIARIISRNIWQMDGLTSAVPQSIAKRRLNAVVGNPPYQVRDGGAKASSRPVYNFFVEQAEALRPEFVSLIMPARWYTGGKGLSSFRNKMIHDTHIIILHDFVDSGICFENVDIKGGVCYFLWSAGRTGKCTVYRHDDPESVICSERYLAEADEKIFIRYNELISIKNKVCAVSENSFESLVSVMKPYGLRGDFFSNTEKYGLPAISCDFIESGYKILGLNKLKREYRYIPAGYPLPKTDMLHDYKVFVTRNYGTGNLSDLPSNPVVAVPGELCTETFVQIGSFRTEQEAQNVIRYIRTRFFRAMVGLRKQDQCASKAVYHFVPMQNFSSSSDIDWNLPAEKIDEQLYRKYSLSQEEINFINSRIK